MLARSFKKTPELGLEDNQQRQCDNCHELGEYISKRWQRKDYGECEYEQKQRDAKKHLSGSCPFHEKKNIKDKKPEDDEIDYVYQKVSHGNRGFSTGMLNNSLIFDKCIIACS